MTHAFIGVGSNIAAEGNIRQALHRLEQHVRIIGVSTFYRQPAVGRSNQPDYINGVVAIATDFSWPKLQFGILHKIEDELGRRRTADKFASRTIDLDLLLYEGGAAGGGEPPLLHPDIGSRAFVAIPLSELAPSLVLPGPIPILDVAARFSAHKMERLQEYTCQLRNELLAGSQFLL